MSWDFRELGTRICVCYDVTNEQALKVWREEAATVGKLTQLFDCGRNCAMCIPYFETLLTEFQAGTWPVDPASDDGNWFGGKHG
jgi:bacterioferritin-associated ferredoxin